MTASSGRIVVGCDGSISSANAIDWAAAEAHRRRCPLELAHVSPPNWVALSSDVSAVPNPKATDRPAYVDDTMTRLAVEWPHLQVSPLDLAGGAAAALLSLSDDIALLVVGARGRSRATALVLGSVSRHVATHARCPVVVVRGHLDDAEGWPVAVGVDGSPQSMAALLVAAAEARLRGVQLLVLNAWQDMTYTGYGVWTAPIDMSHDLQERAEHLTSRAVEEIAGAFPDLVISTRVLRSHPVPAVLGASEQAQLLVVGAHGRGAFPGMGVGSVSSAAIHGAACPVLVVPAPRTA